jgi:DNA-binding MarR family transcriptional regulator
MRDLADKIAADLFSQVPKISAMGTILRCEIETVIESSLIKHLLAPNRVGLTAEQLRCLKFIYDATENHQVAPSYEEIQRHLGLKAKSGIHRLITELESRGVLTRIPFRARAISVTNLGVITLEAA